MLFSLASTFSPVAGNSISLLGVLIVVGILCGLVFLLRR